MRRWREYVQYHGITVRLAALFLLLVILPYLLLAGFVFVYFENHTISNLGQTNLDTLTAAASSIHTAMLQREDDSMAVYHSGCVELLGTGEPLTEGEEERIQSALSALSYSNTGIQAAYLTAEQGTFYSGSSFFTFLELMEPFEAEIVSAGGKCLWYTTNQLGSADSNKYILARSLNSRAQKNVGILYLVLSDRMVTEAFGALSTEYSQWYLTDEQGTVLYCSDAGQLGQSMDISMLSLKKSRSYQTVTNAGGQREVIASYSLMDVGWYCVSRIGLHTLQESAWHLMVPLLLVSLVYILFLLLMLYFMRRYVFRPLGTLKRSMDQYAQDGLGETEVEIVGIGEFRSLSAHFNSMTQRISTLMRAYRAEEEEKNRQKMRALAAQLSPHFVYNALNTIKWVAVLNHQQRIQTLVESLVSIFMNAVRTDDGAYTLRDELKLIEHYAVIQKARFMNFELKVQVEEDCLDCRIRKLLLQPIVENAIVHGLNRGKVKNGVVLIRGWIREGDLTVVISDDGVGFDVERWRSTARPKEEHTNIGLHNVEEIMQLEYGAPYGLRMESTPGQGTTMTCLLPAVKGERGKKA